MKIGPLESIKPAAPASAERKPVPAPGPQPEASAQVDLSARAAIAGDDAADPAFDSAKVDRIAQAIRDGKFKIDPEAIADKLIINAQELLGRKLSS